MKAANRRVASFNTRAGWASETRENPDRTGRKLILERSPPGGPGAVVAGNRSRRESVPGDVNHKIEGS